MTFQLNEESVPMSIEMGRRRKMKATIFCATEGEGRGIFQLNEKKYD